MNSNFKGKQLHKNTLKFSKALNTVSVLETSQGQGQTSLVNTEHVGVICQQNVTRYSLTSSKPYLGDMSNSHRSSRLVDTVDNKVAHGGVIKSEAGKSGREGERRQLQYVSRVT